MSHWPRRREREYGVESITIDSDFLSVLELYLEDIKRQALRLPGGGSESIIG